MYSENSVCSHVADRERPAQESADSLQPFAAKGCRNMAGTHCFTRAPGSGAFIHCLGKCRSG